MTPGDTGLAASVHQRLLNHSKALEVDFGIGDSPTPPAEWIEYPTLLDLPRPRLRAYRAETTIAEKLHAMVVLDLQNSRMKDFFDVWRLAQMYGFVGAPLAASVQDTFARRKTAIPSGLPAALTPAFAQHPSKAQQWQAFLAKSNLRHITEDPATVDGFIARFLEPVLGSARDGTAFDMFWPPGGPWQTGRSK
jgi:hypothetical protein